MEDIVIDTDILIDLLRKEDYALLTAEKIKNENLFTTDINAFELFHGAYKSRHKEKNLASVKGLLNSLYLISTDEDSMEIAAKLLAELEETGKIISLRDLFIASLCLVNSFKLLTRNKRHFELIKDLQFVEL